MKNSEYNQRDYKFRTRDCVICGKNFTLPKKSRAICCSPECSSMRAKERYMSYKLDPLYRSRMADSDKKHRNSDKKKKWKSDNRKRLSELHNQYVKDRKVNDKEFHIGLFLRSCVRRMVKNKKNFRSADIASYTPSDLRKHLESLFREGMSWETYGRTGWHIVHIKPLSAFNFFDNDGNVNMNELKEAMSLKNLQPLWYDENIRKGGIRKMRTN